MDMFIHEFFPVMEELYKKELFKQMFEEPKKDLITVSNASIKLRDLSNQEDEVIEHQKGVDLFSLVIFLFL